MTAPKRVELVIPVHNRKDLTLQCLRSLARVRQDGLEAHVVIVDDGSTDGTADAVAETFPDTQIVQGDGNLFYTAAINRGLEAALARNPDYIVALNDDSVFDENFLLSLVETAERSPRSVVGGLLLLWDRPHMVFQTAPRWELWSGGYRHWTRQTVWTVPKKPWEVELIVGNCLLFPADALRECGLMDEKRFPQYGDAEFTPRMRRRGWKLLVDPGARVFCQPNDTPARLRELSVVSIFRKLFLDPYSGHSLRRRLNANMYGGPGKLEGLLATVVFFVRWAVGRNFESVNGPDAEEPRLDELYGDEPSSGSRP